MIRHRIWDPLVRIFHWTLVILFTVNAFVTDPEEKLHKTIGYVVVGLILFRLVWGFVGGRHARFANFFPRPSQVIEQIGDILKGRKRVHLGHTPLGALMIFNLIATVAAIGITGYMMTTLAYFGIDWVEETHESLVIWAEISIVFHVAAVIWESRRTGVNLPQAMITGVKAVPQGAKIIS